MIEKLNQLIEIMAAISETYYDENEFLDSGYPFDKSFDSNVANEQSAAGAKP